MDLRLDHVALLVKSVETSAESFRGLGATVGPKERFEGEGTEEIYVGDPDQDGLLLLQAPVSAGPYLRAREKRGYGLHHVALRTDDFDGTNRALGALGWFVHPASLARYEPGAVVYYVRPGVGVIIELKTVAATEGGSLFVEEVMVRVEPGKESCIRGLGLKEIACSATEAPYIRVRGTKYAVEDVV